MQIYQNLLKQKILKKSIQTDFFNCGISECNMMSTAAGIASTGKIVFASSFAMFAAGRAFEQIRNSITHSNLNVKIGATHAGISVGEDGATHQCLEDISLMRTLPNMVVINPADYLESKFAVKAAIEHDGPVYLRFGRLAVDEIFDEKTYKFELGKGVLLQEGTDVTIFATGLMTSYVLEANEILKSKSISARIVNIHTIKPIDKKIIVESAEKTNAIVTVEEHNIIGGLGSAVSEVLSEERPTFMKRIGMKDCFGCSGKPNDLFRKYELDPKSIAQEIENFLKRIR